MEDLFLLLNGEMDGVSCAGEEPFQAMTAIPAPAHEESELIRKVAKGDRVAFSGLFDRYHQLVLNIAWRILNERQDAEDVAQEVFLQLWREAGGYSQDRGSLSSWIVTISRTRSIDKLRSRKARRIQDTSADEDATDDLAQLPDPGTSQGILDNRLLMRKAFGSLPVDQRVVIEMAYYEGMSQSEIADALREPLGTIKTRIRSGLIRLKQALGAGQGN